MQARSTKASARSRDGLGLRDMITCPTTAAEPELLSVSTAHRRSGRNLPLGDRAEKHFQGLWSGTGQQSISIRVIARYNPRDYRWKNGAGKSTLMSIPFTILQSGQRPTFYRAKRPISLTPPAMPQASGMVVPALKTGENFTVLENYLLGPKTDGCWNRSSPKARKSLLKLAG